jgi:16S rRNA (adenine1518-N6/adenine1519-N6)-dimethyltransferase
MPYSRLASPSATIAVLERHGLYTRKAFGQHFLVDDNIVGRIADRAALRPGEHVLEVGPGIGTLTDALLSAGARVTAVEYDTRLIPVLEGLADEGRDLRVVHGDAVNVPVESLGVGDDAPEALVANLPYAVAATVVLRFFDEMPSIQRAVVMVQAEVADRMAAVPGTKAYGAYTVKLGLRARVTGRFPVPRTCFLPPPRVDSSVISLERAERGPEERIRAAGSIADAAFSQRRKTVRNSLAAGMGVGAEVAAAILDRAGIDGSLRAENLDVEQFLALGAAAEGSGGVVF